MKSAYVKPSMTFEIFYANEYVAACYRQSALAGKTTYLGDCTLGDMQFDIEGDIGSYINHTEIAVSSYYGEPPLDGAEDVTVHYHKYLYLFGVPVAYQGYETASVKKIDGKYYSVNDVSTEAHPNASV